MPTRRTVLAAAVAGLGAGCAGEQPPSTDGSTADASPTPAASDEPLDLREANVVGVDVESRDGDSYRLAVTLYHDDDGEDGYANWWQVETTGGERLGRRELTHAHGTRRFTRSDTVTVPEGLDRIVVRGHDQTHGYGGRAAVVALPDGAVTPVRQGSDPQTVTPPPSDLHG